MKAKFGTLTETFPLKYSLVSSNQHLPAEYIDGANLFYPVDRMQAGFCEMRR